jgi:hypothetical protein
LEVKISHKIAKDLAYIAKWAKSRALPAGRLGSSNKVITIVDPKCHSLLILRQVVPLWKGVAKSGNNFLILSYTRVDCWHFLRGVFPAIFPAVLDMVAPYLPLIGERVRFGNGQANLSGETIPPKTVSKREMTGLRNLSPKS